MMHVLRILSSYVAIYNKVCSIAGDSEVVCNNIQSSVYCYYIMGCVSVNTVWEDSWGITWK